MVTSDQAEFGMTTADGLPKNQWEGKRGEEYADIICVLTFKFNV